MIGFAREMYYLARAVFYLVRVMFYLAGVVIYLVGGECLFCEGDAFDDGSALFGEDCEGGALFCDVQLLFL